MQAGKLRHYIYIKKVTETLDEGGGFSPVEEVYQNPIPARVTPKKGREIFGDDQRQQEITHEIEVRFNNGIEILPKYIIEFGSRRFTIEYIRDIDERNIKFILGCLELQGEAYQASGNQQVFNTSESPVYNTDGNPIYYT
ncbi:MAG: hypothetical protein DRH26_16295 [Deltaproteobacteria bacterium]|nr:MAG: hypothetical protein DRH26_16295 [Deltaproteobacteria bacterium]